MSDFHSTSLDRTFDQILFVSNFERAGSETIPGTGQALAPAGTSDPHAGLGISPAAETPTAPDEPPVSASIAEILADPDRFEDRNVSLRGKIMKVNNNIMGKNWVHIRDSSTLDDLTITTKAVVDLEDIVVVEGKLTLDKDFGYGYVYPLIVEDASVNKE